MKILLASSEAVPFAKTGGLADVCGALPLELAKKGHQCAVILPAYRQAKSCGREVVPTGIEFIIPIGSKNVAGRLLRSSLPGEQVPVYLVEQDQYFDRNGLYREGDEDYSDNCERFVFFCRAVLEAIRLLELEVEVIHANDWQTGLIPAFLELEYHRVLRYEKISTLFTIHNMAYQGVFWHWDMLLTGLDWKHFNYHQMEFYGKLNLLKTGMVFAQSLSTVSPRYALEIQTPMFGCGLDGVLQHRRFALSGILNGVDTEVWDPSNDPHIAARYDAETFAQGKAQCKGALQSELGLPTRPDVPLLGFVGRLAHQKGIDLITEILPHWAETTAVQWVFLGTGDRRYENQLREYAQRFPDHVATRLEFSDAMAHRIEAGADMFLMPSRYEPCGLNQMYSLIYGAVPVVRETGGLADTVVDCGDHSLAAGTANGFSFRDDSPAALDETIRRACVVFHEPERWSQLIRTGMQQDWSWSRSADEYLTLYEQTRARRALGT